MGSPTLTLVAGGSPGFSSQHTRERKVRTIEELEAAIRGADAGSPPTRAIWIHESLEDEARQLMELGKADRLDVKNGL